MVKNGFLHALKWLLRIEFNNFCKKRGPERGLFISYPKIRTIVETIPIAPANPRLNAIIRSRWMG